ncbi:MAG: CobW family GTP-binding protein [Rubrivivax sp.]
MREPIPVTIVGGYLGAGKTTLVNHLLRQRDGRRIAVLVNDFGELAIDAELIEAREGDLLRLAGGCVCCSFGSDLMAALLQMRDMQPAPQHILIETSGVALPGAVARTLTLVDGLLLDAVLVLADARTVRSLADDRYVGDVVRAQLQQADLVVINKADLVDPPQLALLQAWLAERPTSARVPVLICTQAELDIDVVLGLSLGDQDSTSASPAALSTESGLIRAAPVASALFDSFSQQLTRAVNIPALAAALVSPELGVLRAKALLRDAQAPQGQGTLLQLVGNRVDISAWPQLAGCGQLVAIGLRGRLDHDGLRAALVAAQSAREGDCPTAARPGF